MFPNNNNVAFVSTNLFFPSKFGAKDLCQADPKSFTAQWTMILPTNDVLQLR